MSRFKVLQVSGFLQNRLFLFVCASNNGVIINGKTLYSHVVSLFKALFLHDRQQNDICYSHH